MDREYDEIKEIIYMYPLDTIGNCSSYINIHQQGQYGVAAADHQNSTGIFSCIIYLDRYIEQNKKEKIERD